MAIYNGQGQLIESVFDYQGSALTQCYNLNGDELMGGGDDPFIKTILPYDTNYIISSAWLANATTQRNLLISECAESEGPIPFFIQTDGHGRYSEGNKACHNLAEETLRYIPNIQLGDYESYYNNGNNPINHKRTTIGIINYISVMGNHEFLNNNSEGAELANLQTLVNAYTPNNAILGSDTYGYYKILDSQKTVKYLVTQPHIPDENDSKGFIWKITSNQYDWLINELEANDGYDVIVIQHEPINGTYVNTDGTTSVYNFPNMSIGEILTAKKAKANGSYTDSDNVTHQYDFTGSNTDLLCVLCGHHHKEAYLSKNTFGFPVYVADWFGHKYTCAYGLIDRENSKLKIWKFSSQEVAPLLELDL